MKMFVLLTLALVCTAAASSSYGAPTYDGPSHQNPSYGGGYGGGYGDGYPDYSSESSEEKPRRRSCKKLGEVTLPTNDNFKGREPEFFPLERNGKQYTRISCPNDGKIYSLIGDKTGSTVQVDVSGAPAVENSILLATGVNIDVVARCKGRRTYVKANNGDKIRIKKAICLLHLEKVETKL